MYQRGRTAERGYGGRWQRERKAFLAQYPLCRACRAKGFVAAAGVVDHIVPHCGDQALFWDRANWQPLCKQCHDAKTVAEQQGESRPDWLPKPACPVTLVCGPPGSGKSSYVAAHKAQHDSVIDLDELKAQISGLPIYVAGIDWLGPALAERNRRLALLASTPSKARAWVIVSAPSSGLRSWWRDKLAATDVVVCQVPAAECKRRIRADPRRPEPVADEHVRAVDTWFAVERGRKSPPALKRGCRADGMPSDPAHPWNRG